MTPCMQEGPGQGGWDPYDTPRGVGIKPPWEPFESDVGVTLAGGWALGSEPPGRRANEASMADPRASPTGATLSQGASGLGGGDSCTTGHICVGPWRQGAVPCPCGPRLCDAL